MIFESMQVIFCLSEGAVEVLAFGFHFDEDGTFPEEVDIAIGSIEPLDAMFERRDFTIRDTEHMKELNEELFGFGVFVLRGGPFFRESESAVFDFVPAKCHRGFVC